MLNSLGIFVHRGLGIGLLVALLWSSTAQAGFRDLLRHCYQPLVVGFSLDRKSRDPVLESVAFGDLALRFKKLQAEWDGVALTESGAWHLLRETFQAEEIFSLLGEASVEAPSIELMQARLDALLGSIPAWSILSHLESSLREAHSRCRPEGAKSVARRKCIEEFLTKKWEAPPAAEAEAEATELSKRRKRHSLKVFLSQQSNFPIKALDERTLLFPSGSRLSYRDRQGRVGPVAFVPYDWLIRTQTNHEREGIESALRDPGLKNMIFSGVFLPDGRVLLYDQHHRIAAYASKISTQIPVALPIWRRTIEGRSEEILLSDSYIAALNFFGLLRNDWLDGLDVRDLESDEGRKRLLEKLAYEYAQTLRLRSLIVKPAGESF